MVTDEEQCGELYHFILPYVNIKFKVKLKKKIINTCDLVHSPVNL